MTERGSRWERRTCAKRRGKAAANTTHKLDTRLVDTHIHKLGRNLGFTERRDVSWRTAAEITDGLRRFDPEDPVKYDFSLCHMGMLQRCPSRRDPARCEGCGVLGVCRHWA